MKQINIKKKLNHINQIPPNQPINSPSKNKMKKVKNKENKEIKHNI